MFVRKSKSFFLFYFFIFINQKNEALIHELEQWFNGNQNIYLFYDWHCKEKNPKQEIILRCIEQRNDIIHYSKKFNAFLILEDMGLNSENVQRLLQDPFLDFDLLSHTNPTTEAALSKWVVNDPIACPLGFMGSFAHNSKLKYKIIEFRQIKSDSLFHILTLKEHFNADVMAMLGDRIAEDIKKYNDGQTLNNFYQQSLEPYYFARERGKQLFDILLMSKKSAKETLKKVPYNIAYDEILNKIHYLPPGHENFPAEIKLEVLLERYDSTLIDALIMHSIYENNSEKIIFVMAGGAHLNRITPILEKLGYSKIKSLGTKWCSKNEPSYISISDFFK
jgi:hypothetical protein